MSPRAALWSGSVTAHSRTIFELNRVRNVVEAFNVVNVDF